MWWEAYIGKQSDYHVVPYDDLRPHIHSKECWCKPIEDDEGLNILTHRSLDGRELFETGERKPS